MSLSRTTLSAAVLMALAGTAVAAAPNANTRAQALAGSHRAELKASDRDSFSLVGTSTDNLGNVHTRMTRTYAGLRVLEGDLVMHDNGRGSLRGVSMTQREVLHVNPRPSVSQEDAIVEAGARTGINFTSAPKAELVVDAHGGTGRLAYAVTLHGVDARTGIDIDKTVIVSAQGKAAALYTINNIHETAAAATFKTLYSGTVSSTTNSISGGYELRDPSRGNGWTVSGANGKGSGQIYTDADNTWGNGTVSDTASAAADAQYGVGVTWDYYKAIHGRNGIANDGKGAQNRVHYGRNYVNAYWSDGCFCMTYGDGNGTTYGPLVNIDVAGHEMSHGVMSREANLTYSGESGGLNEANSDIMGTMVEFFSNNANDGGDYLIGEKIYISNPGNTKALRYMFQPSIEGNGAASSDCWYSGVGSLDVHYSSGPANHFFYMLAEGTAAQTFPGSTRVHSSKTCVAGNQRVATGTGSLNGIGRDDAQKIWYNAVRDYMTAGTNYAGARAATISSATDLFGASSAQVAAVKAAWSAVGVN
jgi:Zn-dependent metalloprotease